MQGRSGFKPLFYPYKSLGLGQVTSRETSLIPLIDPYLWVTITPGLPLHLLLYWDFFPVRDTQLKAGAEEHQWAFAG